MSSSNTEGIRECYQGVEEPSNEAKPAILGSQQATQAGDLCIHSKMDQGAPYGSRGGYRQVFSTLHSGSSVIISQGSWSIHSRNHEDGWLVTSVYF